MRNVGAPSDAPATGFSLLEPDPPLAPPMLDPAELAALVNDALVEQARLHGVDIA